MSLTKDSVDVPKVVNGRLLEGPHVAGELSGVNLLTDKQDQLKQSQKIKALNLILASAMDRLSSLLMAFELCGSKIYTVSNFIHYW